MVWDEGEGLLGEHVEGVRGWGGGDDGVPDDDLGVADGRVGAVGGGVGCVNVDEELLCVPVEEWC